MKPFPFRTLVALLVMTGLPACALAQYSLDWSTLDGGGTSTGGVYSVTCTIGQPDAGNMSGDNFTLDGGFWGLIAAVQTPAAPYLSITLNPQLSTITISWPASAEGWVLTETSDLKTPNWVNVAQTPQQVGSCMQVVISPVIGTRFYRLHKP